MSPKTATSGIPKGCFAPDKIPAKWRGIVHGIPGYDPTRGAAGCWFDPKAAQRAIDFFGEMLVHIEGGTAGQPFALEPWQQAVIGNLFGWKTRRKGKVARRYRELFVYVPRKNGKTPLVGGIALFLFFVDDEPGQQGVISAKSREQAGQLFRHMEHMVRKNPHLARRCKIYGGSAPAGQSRSFVKDDASFLKVISGDGDGKHGGNPHVVIIDELHEQDNRELIDALTTSMTSETRTQSLFISLTTADHDRPSVCNEKYEWAVRVQADPALDPAFLPVIYEAGPADDPHAEATWEKANPNLDVSVSRDDLRRLSTRAREQPAFRSEFMRLHLNVRTRPLVANAIDLALWDGCGEAFDPADLEGRPCWAGLDFGWREDYAALVLAVLGEDGGVYVRPYFWLPREGKRDQRVMPTAGFLSAGLVTLTEGNSTDIEAIYAVIADVRRRYDLIRIAVDPNNARKQCQDLMADGVNVMDFVQSKRNYTEPWRWLMAHGLKGGELHHGGDPVLRWMAGNVAVETNGLDEVMPKKKRSAEKIDGICATLMALGAWLTEESTSQIPDRPMVF